MSNIIALIPARSGSTRIPDKNIRELAGHPLMAYAIVSAEQFVSKNVKKRRYRVAERPVSTIQSGLWCSKKAI